ncbi:Gfo/Idh/MocA family oxidoreductase [Bacillus sp. DNRA2]|uniref:Gfo/Idh/MocA family protein n=1 Tax=Bacillus sp. DNRA2 TaxID=2723053 RepID=UPI00145F78B5|nr:Gfo/Idh/MocA family oxidoreductase [Bacillus sp. DNRA2]NMD68971.1 Gfo/Idh/MocA family oxidoreductase [Bacillus sp. DNRA2]
MIRFGVIGTNWITDSFIEGASKHPDFQLTAVYSRSLDTAKSFVEKHQANITIFTNLIEMAQSNELDAVYIASPNAFHARQAIVLIEHGKHVLCEKSIASNKAELEAMISAARKQQVVLMEAVKSTLTPNFQTVMAHLDKIGTVRSYFASYCQYSSRYDAYKQGNILNAFKPEFSNGAIMDIGIYCIYPLVVLFGAPESIEAKGIILESGVDGKGSIILKYKDMDAVVMFSKISNSALPAEIQGEEGNLWIDKIHTPERVELRIRNGKTVDLSEMQKQETMYYEAKEFIELIQHGKQESSINSLTNSLIVMDILDEARKQMGVVFPADHNPITTL